jgi:hypothetical protein
MPAEISRGNARRAERRSTGPVSSGNTLRERRPGDGGRSRLAWLGGGGVAIALVALLFTSAIAAQAATTGPSTAGRLDVRTPVAANFTGNFSITRSSVVNNVTSLVATTVRTLTGNMTGTLVAYEWGVVQANGSMWVSGKGTFVGSILGSAPGLLTISWHKATGTFGGSVSGTVYFSDGEKGLRGVHGSGTASVSFTGGYGFDGNYALSMDLH